MVQLVRIVSNNETQTDVTNYFNEAITIKPNSKIALESLKIELNDTITVTTDNNTFDTQISTWLPNYQVTLNNGIYTQVEFVEELTRAMAASMLYTFTPRIGNNEDIYTEWKPIIFNDKLVIQFATAVPDTGRLCNFKGDLVTGKIVEIQQTAVNKYYIDDVYYRNDNDLANFAYIVTERVTVNGAIEFRATVNTNTIPTLAQATNWQNIYVGLRDIDSVQIPVQSPNELTYSIGIFQGNTIDFVRLISYIDGDEAGQVDFENPLVSGQRNNVSLKITIQQGYVKFWYSVQDINGNGTWIEMPSDPTLNSNFSYSTQCFGYLFMGNQYNTLQSVCFTSSPYQNSNSSGLSLVKLNSEIQDLENHIKYDALGQPATNATSHTIIMSDKVKKLLGFVLNQYTILSIASQFLADFSLDLGYYSDELIVELPTEYISSYEGSQNRRRNIIRYIPSDLLQLTKTRSHIFQYPLYLELQNKEQKVLNYFQVRLLDKDFKPLTISGNAGSMTVLLIIEN